MKTVVSTFTILFCLSFDGTCGQQKSVLIVGGGVAGISAASHLAKNGNFQVTLLEAGDRIGGRMNTVTNNHGTLIEKGAQWMHGENKVYDLVKPYGAQFLVSECTEDSGSRTDFGTVDGIRNLTEAKLAEYEMLHELMFDGPSEENVTVNPFLSLGDWFHDAVNMFNVTGDLDTLAFMDLIEREEEVEDSADTLYDVSARGFLVYTEENGCQNIVWTKGYTTLFNILLNENMENSTLPDWIRLNQEVLEIDYAAQPIVTRTADGSVYQSDMVIVAVSLGVLKAKHEQLFNPPLSPLKVRTIQNLGFGTVNKIHAEFEEAWWPEGWEGVNLLWFDEETPEFPSWTRGIQGFYTAYNNNNTLTGWITGEEARFAETISNDKLTEIVNNLLRKFTGRTDIPNATVSVTTWYTNPFTRGSYSFRSVQSEEQDVWASDLAEPIPVFSGGLLCFAGEATHNSSYSTVHGAYETGIREANRIIEFPRNTPIDYKS